MEVLAHCPICNSERQKPFLTCIDHLVSKKEFPIVQCVECGFRFTNPRPSRNEIGEYYRSEKYIPHSTMKKGFLTYAYHLVRRYTRTKKLRLISTYYKQGNLLDIGCGTGEFLDRCRKAGFTTVGIEPNLEARNYAMKVYKLDVRDEGALNDLNNSSFEVITMWHALEHMHKLNEMVIEICRLLKPNGTLFIAVPNCTSMDAAIYKTYWAAYDVPRHLYHFTPADITKLFEKHSMRIESILPMWFDSFYVSMMSEKYKKGMMIRALWNGFRSNLAALRTRQTFSSQLYVIKK